MVNISQSFGTIPFVLCSNKEFIATARAAQSVHRYGGATAATEHALQRREQRSLCIATVEHRQEPSSRDGESRADYVGASTANAAPLERSER